MLTALAALPPGQAAPSREWLERMATAVLRTQVSG
jgi:hypothetical protein